MYNSHIQTLINRVDEKKRLLDNHRPLPPEVIRNLDEWFAVDFTYNSNAIEGNTLTPSETALVVEKGITIAGKSLREHLEAINHVEAIEYIKQLSHKQRSEITTDDILAIHKIVLAKIDTHNAGVFRKVNVRISGSTTIFPNYAKVPVHMVGFMQWLHSANEHPVIVAARAHFDLVSIHPFVDGNGRASRLLMNLLLLQCGYPLAVIKNQNRPAYIKAIELARDTSDYTNFFTLVLEAVESSLDIYLQAIAE